MSWKDNKFPDADKAEDVGWLIDQLKGVVRSYETQVANEAASAGVVDIDPT